MTVLSVVLSDCSKKCAVPAVPTETEIGMKRVLIVCLVALTVAIMTPSCLHSSGRAPSAAPSSEAPSPGGESDSGRDQVAFPRPVDIPGYAVFSGDQRVVLDAIESMLANILQNGPEVGRMYPLARRVGWADFSLAKERYASSFPELYDIIVNIGYIDSRWSGRDENSIYLYDHAADEVVACYQRYLGGIGTSVEQDERSAETK